MTPNRTIVVIEDQDFTDRVIRGALRKRPYDIVTANDGEAGLELVKAIKPDLVLLDISLPRMDGWQVLAEIRATDEVVQTPVVIVTAQGHAASDPRVGALDVEDVLTKPFLVRQLRDAVDAVMERSVAA
ncbi:MAG: response regulator [Acidimicrobiia bacterium]|nr:response regulator [Acidimicrobiia bacterium]MDH3470606.1 response regulator [Acidimicrobiia bacterium]